VTMPRRLRRLWLDRRGHTAHRGMADCLRRSPGFLCKGASLDLDLDVSFVGRKPKQVNVEILREITESDLALLETERGIKPSHIARLSERHHALARCLASGLSVADACAITGYTQSRVSILKGDPSFEELISFYTRTNGEAVRDLTAKMTAVAHDAVGIIQERLEDQPDEIPLDSLLDIAKFSSDRTGHGPQSRQQHLHVHMNLADRLKTARERVGALPAAEGPGLLVEGTLAPTSEPAPAAYHSQPKEPS
jgi:hypothetical protein